MSEQEIRFCAVCEKDARVNGLGCCPECGADLRAAGSTESEHAGKTKYYRCGWCGHPTNADGIRISENNPELYVKEMEETDAELVRNVCQFCPTPKMVRDRNPRKINRGEQR